MNDDEKATALEVESTLKYGKSGWSRHHFYVYPQSDHRPAPAEEIFSNEKVTVRDGREMNATIATNGFKLINHQTSLRNEDFYSDESMITGKYYKEMEAAVKELTGAKHVLAYNHTVRREQKSPSGDVRTGYPEKQVQVYAHLIHADASGYMSDLNFKNLSSKIDKKEDLRGKYMIFNAWRSISDKGPVKNWPLAVLDCTSLATPEDCISINTYYEKFSAQHYILGNANKHRHRWVYFPNMEKNELLVFTQYDSDPKATARQTFHSSFKDPTSPVDAPIRESVEVRLLCIFPNHKPNTCPVISTAKAGTPQASYEGIIYSMKSAMMRPPEAKLYRSCAGDPMKAMKGLVKRYVDKDHYGLGGASEEFQSKVLALLEENIGEVDWLMQKFFSESKRPPKFQSML